MVAFGTSAPEITTSFTAAFKGESDIAIGNVIGSSVFNLTAVLGVSALLAEGGLTVDPGVIAFDLPVMLAVAVLCFPILFTHHSISRWEGLLFLVYYVVYVVSTLGLINHWLITPGTPSALTLYLVPAVVLSLIVGLYRWMIQPSTT